MSEQTGQDWHRLARLVIHRRVQLGHQRQTEFADASGLKIRTLNNIENARRTSYDASTIALLEQGLHWAPGSADAVLAGGDPAPHHPEAEATGYELAQNLSDEARAALLQRVDNRMLLAELARRLNEK